MSTVYGTAPRAVDVESASEDGVRVDAQHPRRSRVYAAAVGLAAVAGVLGVLMMRSKYALGIAPLPHVKPVPKTATFSLDAKCVDGAPTAGAHRGFFTSPITGAAVVKHNYGEDDFFSYGEKIPMQLVEFKKFTLTTDQVDWEWSFVLENARGEYLYEAGQSSSPLGRTWTSDAVKLADKQCIQKYGKYFNRVRTIDTNAAAPSYAFGTCDAVCPPPPPPPPPPAPPAPVEVQEAESPVEVQEAESPVERTSPPPAPVEAQEAESPLERTSTPPMIQSSSGGRVSMDIEGNPGVPVGEFGAIATAYGDTVQKEVRAVSWYAFEAGSRSVNVHSVDQTYNQKWKQEAKVTYMFTLKKLVEQGAVVTIGGSNANLDSSSSGVKNAGPWSWDHGKIKGKKPIILCTTWTPHSYPDTFIPNVYNLNIATGKFNVGVSRVDSPWTTTYGWGDDAIVVSYVAFDPDAALKAPTEVFAIGELKVPKPSATDKTYSAVELKHNLGHSNYKCLATVRQEITDLTTSDRTIGVECQAAGPNQVTLMTMDVGYRDWSSTTAYKYADNVYVQYVLVPDIGAPVIKADYFTGTPSGNVKK